MMRRRRRRSRALSSALGCMWWRAGDFLLQRGVLKAQRMVIFRAHGMRQCHRQVWGGTLEDALQRQVMYCTCTVLCFITVEPEIGETCKLQGQMPAVKP